ncbi:alcohol oxidase [Hymenopellis radicata]|nr:alcohol oxidase [Hymenopellis radicata]
MFSSLSTIVALLFLFPIAQAQCPDASDADYDYIVVGSGAGGGPVAARLAEAGFSVLVVDAGHDINSINTTIPLYFVRSVEDEALELAYTLNEYPADFEFQKSSWYPRARGLGGSTIHNAMINIIAETRSDFDGLASMFNDSTWSRDNMQNYFKKIERHVYPVLNDDHGTDGWLTTNMNPVLAVLNPMFLDLQIVDFIASITLSGLPVLDLNSIAGDDAVGVTMPSFTITENYTRSSVRDRLVNVEETSGRLTFTLDTLATKVLTCNDSESGSVKAYGVEMAPGAALPVAGNFHGKQDLNTTVVTAKKEVIVSAGAFQTFWIGDREHLQQFGIESVMHLPGVGMNMQDHDEISVIWRMRQNYSIFDGCVLLPDPEQDPCLAYYQEGHQNLYSFGGAISSVTSKSRPEYTEPDMLTYWEPAHFQGFVRGFSQALVDNPNTVTAVHLKAHPSSKGTVRLTGSHPQDLLDIQKNHFQGEDGLRDVEDLRNAIKHSREVMKTLPVALHSDEAIDAHIYNNIFGHHICCTNAMGTDDDEYAVLDGDFRVRGVQNLRVVDASSWPIVPGYFVTTPFYMASEKAADVIIAAGKSA